MDKLQQLRKRHKRLSFALVVVVIVGAFFFGTYFIGNGLSINDWIFFNNSDVRVMLYAPSEGETFYENEEIIISGSVWGDIPKMVYVWDSKHNVPVACTLSASNFGVKLFASDLSAGEHTLCVQAQTNEGKWTDTVSVTITKQPSSYYGGIVTQSNTWVESNLPQPLGIIFRPVEEVLSQIVVYISGGTSDDDLNGDNIPDEIQQSPTTPRYNPMNIPMSAIIIFGLIILLVIIIVVYVVNPYMRREHQLRASIAENPEKREWWTRIQALKNEDLKRQLRREREEKQKLKDQLKIKGNTGGESKNPIRIFIMKNKGGNEE